MHFKKMWPTVFIALMENFSRAWKPRFHPTSLLLCGFICLVCMPRSIWSPPSNNSVPWRTSLSPGGPTAGKNTEMVPPLRSMDGVEIYLPTRWLVLKGINIPKLSQSTKKPNLMLRDTSPTRLQIWRLWWCFWGLAELIYYMYIYIYHGCWRRE